MCCDLPMCCSLLVLQPPCAAASLCYSLLVLQPPCATASLCYSLLVLPTFSHSRFESVSRAIDSKAIHPTVL
ncbi:hypothetical protein CLOM_g17678 [Closterium sp. NIES-68]|nr:hypothetical protein CLOM_g17678 [Closterium sp. NIES-68]